MSFAEKDKRGELFVAGGAFAFWLLLAFQVRSVISGGQDALYYSLIADCFLREGLSCPHPREPLFPLLLSWILRLPFPLERSVPLVQNLFFFGSVFVFTATFTGLTVGRRILLSVLVASVPTFFITMNGAIYTEATSASLVLLQLAAVYSLSKAKLSLPSIAGRWLGLVLSSGALVLSKGSFFYIEVAFVFLFTAFAFKRLPSSRILIITVGLLLGTLSAQNSWQQIHVGGGPKVFDRAGAILYGRTEYALHFNYSRDGWIFLVNAFSESACHKLYQKRCQIVSFLAENKLGNSLVDAGVSDELLFKFGKENLLRDPIRQLIFIPMEWARFVFHHGTTGFARFGSGWVEGLVHSFGFNLVMKMFNIFLYFSLILMAIRRKKGGVVGLRREGISSGLLALLFSIAYLSVYGFATTVIRMAYPFVTLIVILVFRFWLGEIHRFRWPSASEKGL